MKTQKMTGYWPTYPRKALRGAALTAAALVAMGGMSGCRKAPKVEELRTEGIVPMETPYEGELMLDGEVAIPEPEPTEEPALMGKIAVTEPPEEVLVTEGEVAIPQPTEEELILDGEEMIPEPEPTPDPQELTTTGMVYVPQA